MASLKLRHSCGSFIRSSSRPAWFAVALFSFALPSAALGTDSNSIPTTAEHLVDEASAASADGKTARSFALLRQAVHIAPDFELARWQLGQVNVDGKWLAIEEAQRRAAADPRQVLYREHRAEFGETPEGQLALARWCRKNDLEEEGLFHWASVLSADPVNKEALRALDMRWLEGKLVERDDIVPLKKEAVATRRSTRRWTIAVADWERTLAKKDGEAKNEALEEICAVSDPASIPAFERVTLDIGELSPRMNESHRQMGVTFVEALGGIADPKSTESLVRHAIVSLYTDVRVVAIDKLTDRPLHEFVPLLLDGLVAPIESSFRTTVDPDGSVRFAHTMYRQGPLADWSHRTTRTIFQPGAMPNLAEELQPNAAQANGNQQNAGQANPATPATAPRMRSVTAAGAARSAKRYEEELATAEEEIRLANLAAAALNARIFEVLTATTGERLGSEPRSWWDWWQDYTEYYRPEERPVYATVDDAYEYITPPTQCECFVRGTLVWTKTGQRAIETLELGDLVLSQDVNTGELKYKPVIGRTVRPPSPILKLNIGGEEIRATRGHPLWVTGVGWRMAKELADGAVLKGVAGSPRVEAIEQLPDEEAYNLVVADFNTYFVGDSGVLVHDNTRLTPARSAASGLAADR